MKKKIIAVISLVFTAILLVSALPSKSLAVSCWRSAGHCYGSVDCTVNDAPYCCYTETDCTNFIKSSDPTCDSGSGKGISTAIGCIPVFNQTDFLSFVLKWAFGIGGGIAFLLIIYGGFMIMSSGGNPDRLKAGQELITSALAGLILLIFSVFILKFIGVDILGLCHFGFGKCENIFIE